MNRSVPLTLLIALVPIVAACDDNNDKAIIDAMPADAMPADAMPTIDANTRTTQVVDLTDTELEQLCEQFHDGICQNDNEGNCAPSCRTTCSASGTAALMRQECIAPITVAQVAECAALFGIGDKDAFKLCSMGGGCVFDVFDETCP